MKPLVVYYSHSGNNEKLANELKDRIKCETHKISEAKKRNTFSILLDFLLNRNSKIFGSEINLRDFDSIILVAPVWGGKIASPMKSFLEREKTSISNYSYISLCNGETGQNEKITSELYSLINHKPIEVKELSIKSLLPEEQRDKIKHTFNYRVSDQDLKKFEKEIALFIGDSFT